MRRTLLSSFSLLFLLTSSPSLVSSECTYEVKSYIINNQDKLNQLRQAIRDIEIRKNMKAEDMLTFRTEQPTHFQRLWNLISEQKNLGEIDRFIDSMYDEDDTKKMFQEFRQFDWNRPGVEEEFVDLYGRAMGAIRGIAGDFKDCLAKLVMVDEAGNEAKQR